MVRNTDEIMPTRSPATSAGPRAPDYYAIVLTAVSLAGLFVFLLPFLVSAAPSAWRLGLTRPAEASLLMGSVLAGTLFLILGDLTLASLGGGASRTIALLSVLVAIDASLRLFPSFVGASPIFALIVLVGFCFGPRFGFAMGCLTLLISAVLTAGIGPWLPFQMLCAGWVGLGAGLMPRPRRRSRQIVALVLYGAAAGILFGFFMNLYAWPLATPASAVDVGLYWSPGLSLLESIRRYATFYLATSLIHDLTRAVGNAMLIAIAGAGVLRLLQRFQLRSDWHAVSATRNTSIPAPLPSAEKPLQT
jgi:energy-coupling factor transport system substrate-specific component